jgi:serine/threonine-protein kinase
MDNIQPGQMLGSYRIISQIGRGGMANVYKAYQPSVDRDVAIKVLPSQLAGSKEFAARFQQEARIIARLEHPHILPVFDYGESDGTAYFVMRYLDTGTLKDLMESGRPLPLMDINRIFSQLADALSYAHLHGVVHRDLKPANALIDTQGNVFLTDFGIARLLESASPRLTQTDAIMGTPAYISPEQAQGLTVDRRSDIYSLGIILYEMVTGRVPFMADTPLAVLFKQISDPLPLPSTIKPDIPKPLEQVILKALAKDPADRFATAAEFVTAWKLALERPAEVQPENKTVEPVPIQPTPISASRPVTSVPSKKTTSGAGRTIGLLVGCLAGACLLVAFIGVAVFGLSRQNLVLFTAPSKTPLPLDTAAETSLPPTDTPVPDSTDTPIPVSIDNLPLRDDFSVERNGWGTLDNAQSKVQYENDQLRMQMYSKNYVVWSRPNDDNYENIHIEVTAINNDKNPKTAFGIVCGQQGEDWSFYYLAMTPSGEYAIIRATAGEDDVYLTNNGKWGSSSFIKKNAESYLIGADCQGDQMTLYVDGHRIASATDSAYPKGHIGLFAWSGENETSGDVSFDDFTMTSTQ